ICIDEVQPPIEPGNVTKPTRTLYGAHQAFTVQASGQLMNAAAYRPLIVMYRNGAPVRLEQVGRVLDSVQLDKAAAWYNGSRTVLLAIQRQPGTNTIEIIDGIRQLFPTFKEKMHPSVGLHILYDRSVAIRESVRHVELTLLLAIVLVVLVIFVFLRNLPATVIPSLAVPMSILGTFSAMYVFGYIVARVSRLALMLSVGFVVDDAIVMLENISRHIEAGVPRFEAALRGSDRKSVV